MPCILATLNKFLGVEVNATLVIKYMYGYNAKDKINIAKNIAKKLNINHIKINENGMWDFSIIIGKDYRKLDSFNIVKQYYSPF